MPRMMLTILTTSADCGLTLSVCLISGALQKLNSLQSSILLQSGPFAVQHLLVCHYWVSCSPPAYVPPHHCPALEPTAIMQVGIL